jgi:hypothetical protein
MVRFTWWWFLLFACVYYPLAQAAPFLTKTRTTTIIPQTKPNHPTVVIPRRTTSTKRATIPIDDISKLRGGAAIVTDPATLLDVLFSPRVALKTLSVGLGCFGLELLLFPILFRDTFLNLQGLEMGLATDFLQYWLGIRELFLSLLIWNSASNGTDQVCRMLSTLAFVTLNIPQLYYIIRYGDVFRNSQVKRFMLGFQGFFFCLNGGATIKAWNQKMV